MKKIIHITLKVLLSLIMLMPIIGALGVFPAPTADLYSNPKAFAFIEALMSSGYINPIMAFVFALALISLWMKRSTAMIPARSFPWTPQKTATVFPGTGPVFTTTFGGIFI